MLLTHPFSFGNNLPRVDLASAWSSFVDDTYVFSLLYGLAAYTDMERNRILGEYTLRFAGAVYSDLALAALSNCDC